MFAMSQKKESGEIDEIYNLRTISGVYYSEELSGVNEQYHIYLRDHLIPKEGGDSALELGCGKGLWTQTLCERYKEIDIVDISPELLEMVITNCTHHKCKITSHMGKIEDFVKNPNLDRKWKHIYMTFILEHLEFPVDTLKDIAKLMQKDGCLFIAVPNADSVHRVIALRAGLIDTAEELSANDKIVGHRRVYTRNLLVEHVTSAGFDIISESNIGLKPLRLNQMKELKPEIIDGFCASGDLVPNNAAYIAITATPVLNRTSDGI